MANLPASMISVSIGGTAQLVRDIDQSPSQKSCPDASDLAQYAFSCCSAWSSSWVKADMLALLLEALGVKEAVVTFLAGPVIRITV